MKYEGLIIRPPSEAKSLLLQVTVGCSHNRCTFCGSYKGKKFRIKSLEEIEEDIIEAKQFRGIKRVFLCDGDALIIPQKKLINILESIRKHIPQVERVGTYANAKSILRKTVDELRYLKDLGLGIVYLGVETGSEEILSRINKGVSYNQMVEAALRVKEAGMTLSVTIILGLGGLKGSQDHALKTARILTEIDPHYVGALTLMLIPGTPLYEDYQSGTFEPLNHFGFIKELGVIIANSQFTNCLFTSNHASNYLPIRANLPQEKEKVLDLISYVLKTRDPRMLRPEFMRAL
ncbi:MAG: radical SAM protein [Syntrophales bacterium]|nr:radical SAM protein [Syntrophales bacterium]